jgi:hypothetical protein
MGDPTAWCRRWRLVAIGGILIALTGAALLGLDGVFDWDYSEDIFNTIGWATTAGIVLACVGLVGWARHLGRKGRYSLGWGLLLATFAVIASGYLIDGMNAHGSAGPVFLISFMTVVLAITFFIMGGVAKRD